MCAHIRSGQLVVALEIYIKRRHQDTSDPHERRNYARRALTSKRRGRSFTLARTVHVPGDNEVYTSVRTDRQRRRQRMIHINGQLNLTSSLVDLSCRWPGEEVSRSGKTELGREPGDESDLWKSPPPPLLERSPPSRFCKAAALDLEKKEKGTNMRTAEAASKRKSWTQRKHDQDLNLFLFLTCFRFYIVPPRDFTLASSTKEHWETDTAIASGFAFWLSTIFRSRYRDNRRKIKRKSRGFEVDRVVRALISWGKGQGSMTKGGMEGKEEVSPATRGIMRVWRRGLGHGKAKGQAEEMM